MLQSTNKNIILQGKHNKPILVDVFVNDSIKNLPIVIFCHGYKGFKDWGCWDLAAEAFANAGFCFVKFNFSHNGGTVEQPIDFPDMEAFGNNNYIKELDDLETVIDWLISSEFNYSEDVNTNKITLIGHSRGGGIVTLKAYEDKRIANVISWAGVSDYASRFGTEDEIKQWKKDGVKYIVNGRTKQKMPHFYQFYENFKANEARLNIKNAASNLKVPHCIIHGDNDTSVAMQEGQNIHSWNPNSEFVIIPNANHVFGGKHPWEQTTLPNHLQEVIEKSIAFIK